MAKFSGFFPEPQSGGISVGYVQDMIIKPLEEKVLKKLGMLDSLRKNAHVTSGLVWANGVKDVAMAQMPSLKQETVVKQAEELEYDNSNSMKPR